MDKQILKVLHFADIQYNVRGKQLNKKVEYEFVNQQLVEASHDVDLVLIAGDVFEHWDTNNVEETLFIHLIQDILQDNPELQIYCIAGNHDLKQSNNIYDNGTGTKEVYRDTLSKLHDAINDERFVVLNESGIYPITAYNQSKAEIQSKFDNVIIAAWATNECYINGLWCPWIPENIGDEFDIEAFCNNNFVIEMFHAALQEAVNFDGEPVKGDIESRTGLNAFEGHYIALGDIHKYQTFKTKRGIACYPSSTAIRDFGEGDYYVNGSLKQQGNAEHGYVTFEIDVDNKRVQNFKFVPVKQLVHSHTLTFDNDFANVQLDKFELAFPGTINKLRIVNNVTETGLSDKIDKYIAELMSAYTVGNIDYRYGTAALTELNSITMSDADTLIRNIHDKMYLKQVANEYATNIAQSSKIADDMKEDFVQGFCKVFSDELDKLDMTVSTSNYELLTLTANQFMILTDVNVDFSKLGKLTRIAANNGNGKTTLFRLLRWMMTGFIDTWQSSAASKQNHLSYFNDKLENDTLHAELTFMSNVNGVSNTYKLTRTLTRNWKRGTKDITNPYWQSNISKVDSEVTLQNLTTGEEIDNAQIADTLYQIFGSIWEMTRFISLTQDSLDTVIAFKSDELNDWLLDQLGINVFSLLEHTYESVKSALFDGLSKPGKNKETLQSELDIVKQTIESSQTELQAKMTVHTQHTNELGKVRKDIEATAIKLHVIPDHRDIASVERDKLQLQTENATLQKQIETLPTELDESLVKAQNDIENSIANLESQALHEKSLIDAKIANVKAQMSDNSKSQADIDNQIQAKIQNAKQSLQTELDNVTLQVTTKQHNLEKGLISMTNKHNDAIHYKIAKLRDDLQSQLTELQTQAQTQLQTLTQTLTQQLTRTKQTLQSKVNEDNDIKLQAASIKNKFTDLQDKLLKLQQGTCPICANDFSNPSQSTLQYREQLQSQVVTLQEQYNDLGKTHLQLKEDIAKLELEVKNIEDNIANTQSHNASILSTQHKQLTQQYAQQIAELQLSLVNVSDSRAMIAALSEPDRSLYDKHANELQILQQTLTQTQHKLQSFNDDEHVDQTLLADLTLLQGQYDDLKKQLIDLEQLATTRYNEILSGKPKLLEQLESAKKLVEDCKSQLKVREMSIVQINDNKLQLSKLDNEITNIKTYLQQAEDNKVTQQSLDKLHASENALNATLFDLNGEIATLQQTLTHSQTQTQTLTQQLQDLRKWNLVELICNQYRTAISKKGLVSVVFSQIANALNAELNDLLSQCNYRIFFDITDDNILKMIDLVGSRTIRSIKQTSGMQGTFGALGIIDLILKKRLNCIGNILMIDEISGKLSDGKVDMTGKDVNNLNYRDIFAQFLKTLSKDRKVLVVDHILDSEVYDDNIYVNLQLNGTSKLVHGYE